MHLPGGCTSPAEVHPRGKGAPGPRWGHNGPVRFRIGTVVAFAIGYVLGTRAGRERYEQLLRGAGVVGRSAPVTGTVSLVGEKARAAASLGVERLKDTIGVHLGWRDGDQAADAIALDLAEDLAAALNNRRHLSPPVRPADRRAHPASAQASSR